MNDQTLTDACTTEESSAVEASAQNTPPADPLAELQAAYDALQKEYASLQAECSSARVRAAQEAEFHALYPDVSLASLPDAVLHHESLPLCAAYALYLRKEARTAELAAEANAQNAAQSAGAIRHDGGHDGHFALAEIKRMTPKEIRRNYTSVLRSLKKHN